MIIVCKNSVKLGVQQLSSFAWLAQHYIHCGAEVHLIKQKTKHRLLHKLEVTVESRLRKKCQVQKTKPDYIKSSQKF